jgi:hypothetical protein
MSDRVGLCVRSLKLYRDVARAFPVEKRRAELTWSHHLTAHIYVERHYYLQRCIDRGMNEIGKPHSIRWLEELIDEMENSGPKEIRETRETLSISLPHDIVQKFSDLARRYYHRPVSHLMAEILEPVLRSYLAKKAEEISLEYFDCHDSETWPFAPDAAKKLGGWKTKRKAS